MKYQWVVVAAAAALSLSSVTGNATDIVNHDDAAYKLVVTTAEGQMEVEIDPKGEAQNVCEGCEIAISGGDSMKVMADDVVTIVEGTLVVAK